VKKFFLLTLSLLSFLFFFSYHGLGPLTCSGSELTSKTMNSFRNFGRTPWTGDRHITR